jgi:LCP family protein required for cell wall assembly
MPGRRRRWPWVVAFTAWLGVGVAVGAGVASVNFLEETLAQASPDTAEVRAASEAVDPVLPGQPINILLIGSDKRAGKESDGDPGRSDSLILIRMDSRRGFISMLSFPRDLYVEIPGTGGRDKINAAYAIGGPAKTIETVKALTGQDINYFINIDFAGFTKLVDRVGGVYLDVDRRYFNDNSTAAPGQSYATIDINPGYQRLDGPDALDFVRYRHTDSDFSRIARQQQFLSELKRQTNRFGSLPNVPEYAEIFANNIVTNMKSTRRLLGVIEMALTTDKDRVARTSVPGYADFVGDASVVMLDEQEFRNRIDLWLNPEFETGATTRVVEPAKVDTLVLNGNGALMGADDAVDALRARGYDAHVGGNADNFGYRESAVYYREGQRDAAKQIQALIGPGTAIAPLRNGQAKVSADVVVVIGEDFEGRLYTPPKRAKGRTQLNMVSTTTLVPLMRRIQGVTKVKMMAPLRVPTSSELKRVRVYRVNTGGTGPQAVKLVFAVPAGDGPKYWGLQAVDWKNPPLLEGRTGVVRSGGRDYSTFYDGKNLMRLAWQRDGVTYWITNTLDYRLTADEMYAIAKSARPLARATLSRGTSDTAIPVETDAYTP